jgi:hypothetical protein
MMFMGIYVRKSISVAPSFPEGGVNIIKIWGFFRGYR